MNEQDEQVYPTITVAAADCVLGRISAADFKAAQRHIKGERLQIFNDLFRGEPMEAAARGIAIGEIVNHVVTIDEVLTEYSGRIFLLWKAVLNVKANPRVAYDQLEAEFPDDDTVDGPLTVVLTLSKFLRPPGQGEDGADPTTTGERSSTEQTMTFGGQLTEDQPESPTGAE